MTQKDIKEIINAIKENYADGQDTPDIRVKKNLLEEYNMLADLRHRLQYEIEDKNVYEEDIILCDHILDYFEIMISKLIDDREMQEIKEMQILVKGRY